MLPLFPIQSSNLLRSSLRKLESSYQCILHPLQLFSNKQPNHSSDKIMPAPAPPSPPANDLEDVSSLGDCRAAQSQAQTHIDTAVSILQSFPPAPLDSVTSSAILGGTFNTTRQQLATRLPTLVDSHNTLLSVVSSLTKGLQNNQRALEYLLSRAEDAEAR